MPETVDVLIMIHGMISDAQPRNPTDVYGPFYNALVKVQRGLQTIFDDRQIHIQWGHQPPNTPPEDLRDDQRLTRAQSFVHNRVAYDAVRTDPSPNNILMSGLFGGDHNLIPGVRNIVTLLREGVVQLGLADVVYYCAPDGEKQVRHTVYEQVLTQIDQFGEAEMVRLHLVGHSLGVTLAHDFLFGLFAPNANYTPGFIAEEQGSPQAMDLFQKWRNRAQNNSLQLGTLISFASQLPLLMMRKQTLVNQLFAGELLDPTKIGIVDEATARWLIFYDVDDILGFTTRRLYQPTAAIREIQVDSGDLPHTAHGQYWENQTIIRETANLIFSNSTQS